MKKAIDLTERTFPKCPLWKRHIVITISLLTFKMIRIKISVDSSPFSSSDDTLRAQGLGVRESQSP